MASLMRRRRRPLSAPPSSSRPRSVRDSALALEEVCRSEVALVGEDDRPSARNLVHYLAVRQFDLRSVQRELARRGLSSLGRAESHVLATIDAVLGHLGAWTTALSLADWRPSAVRRRWHGAPRASHRCGSRSATSRRPGSPDGDAAERAARDSTVVNEQIAVGMDMARINLADDVEDTQVAVPDQPSPAERPSADAQ